MENTPKIIPPDYYKNRWKKYGKKANEQRRKRYKKRYKNDWEFRLTSQIFSCLCVLSGYSKDYYNNNRVKYLKKAKAWRLKNPKYLKQYHREGTKKLSDFYIRKILRLSLNKTKITDDLIEMKRLDLALSRSLRNKAKKNKIN